MDKMLFRRREPGKSVMGQMMREMAREIPAQAPRVADRYWCEYDEMAGIDRAFTKMKLEREHRRLTSTLHCAGLGGLDKATTTACTSYYRTMKDGRISSSVVEHLDMLWNSLKPTSPINGRFNCAMNGYVFAGYRPFVKTSPVLTGIDLFELNKERPDE